jgi:hypothetical protein
LNDNDATLAPSNARQIFVMNLLQLSFDFCKYCARTNPTMEIDMATAVKKAKAKKAVKKAKAKKAVKAKAVKKAKAKKTVKRAAAKRKVAAKKK